MINLFNYLLFYLFDSKSEHLTFGLYRLIIDLTV